MTSQTKAGTGEGRRGSGRAAGATRTCARNVVRWVGKYVSVLARRLLLYRRHAISVLMVAHVDLSGADCTHSVPALPPCQLICTAMQ